MKTKFTNKDIGILEEIIEQDIDIKRLFEPSETIEPTSSEEELGGREAA